MWRKGEENIGNSGKLDEFKFASSDIKAAWKLEKNAFTSRAPKMRSDEHKKQGDSETILGVYAVYLGDLFVDFQAPIAIIAWSFTTDLCITVWIKQISIAKPSCFSRLRGSRVDDTAVQVR